MGSSVPLGPRVRAPELHGRGWLNTGGEALTPARPRGRVALLDLWTFCRGHRLHVLDGVRPLDGRLVAPPPGAGDLRSPGRAIVSPGGFLVSSWAGHQIVEVSTDGARVLRRIGSGRRGRADGTADAAEFNEPQGLCLLPPSVAEIAGYDLVVADTVNHLLRGVRLADGDVSTVAGTGKPWRMGLFGPPGSAAAGAALRPGPGADPAHPPALPA